MFNKKRIEELEWQVKCMQWDRESDRKRFDSLAKNMIGLFEYLDIEVTDLPARRIIIKVKK